jgi:adenylate cyclase
MGTEIERKFLVVSEAWRAGVVRKRRFEQGYLAITGDCAVRVRIDGDRAELNIKNATLDIERQEFEYPVPLADAREMMHSLCSGRSLSKVRHWVHHDGDTWEIDVFEGANRGLVLAEIEIAHRGQKFGIPGWVGPEVSGDERYLNSYLAVRPYSTW